jgi:hypothetical protein
MNAYDGGFPEQFAHIGFLTVPEAQRLRELRIRPGEALADLACGAGGPGLWMARGRGFPDRHRSLGRWLAAARQRARDAGLVPRPVQHGTFEHTNLADGAVSTVMSIDAFQYARTSAPRSPSSRGSWCGRAAGIVCFEVDPATVAGLPVLGVDPVPDYRPLIAAAGLNIEAYEETPGWQERVYAAFSAIVDNTDTLIAEMGEQAAAAAVAEAMLTVQMKPYTRRIMAVASRQR